MNPITVLVVVLKASLILATALMAVRLAAPARAAIRHLVLAVAFIALLIMPAAMQLLPERAVSIPMARPERAAAVATLSLETRAEVAAQKQSAASPRSAALSADTIVAMVWVAGMLVSLTPLVVGARELRRIRRAALTWDGGAALLADLNVDHGLVRRCSVLLHHDAPGPVTFGVLRPAIVFPPDARQWEIADVRRALLHELEHVRRADWLVDTAARLVCALYWFHPLAWMSWRRLRLEAERACDDAVLRRSDAVAYAEQLVSLAARLSAARAPVLALAQSRDLSSRVMAVLDRAQRRGRAGAAWTTGVLAIGVVAVVLIAPVSAVSQAGPLPPLSYEIASVKENTSGDPRVGGDQQVMRLDPGGRFTARNASLRDLLLLAYRFEIAPSQLNPLDGWMESRRFDITARAADGVVKALNRESAEVMDRMLQGLLADRFKLRVRRESKTGDIYVLSVASGGAKLTPAPNGEACAGGADPARQTPLAEGFFPCHMFKRFGRRGFVGVAINTGDLAQALRGVVGAPVEDHAKLPTLFDGIVNWNLDQLNAGSRDAGGNGEPQASPDDPDMFTALREQLGLTLNRQRGPIETLIVEFAQPPSSD